VFERKSQRLLPRRLFALRFARCAAAAAALVTLSLAIGMLGYHEIERLHWVDAFLNASMIMAGMGPVDTMKTESGKLFAGVYALYCGLALITTAAILLTPLLHRFLHRFHMEEK